MGRQGWLYGKTAIISGASSGIGRELTQILIEKYACHVIGIARNEERLRELADKYPDNFVWRSFDVACKDGWDALAASLQQENTPVDILINNAGMLPPFERFSLTDSELAHRVLEVNYFSALYAVYALMPVIMRSATPAIVNISSSAALAPLAGTSLYSASKAALKATTEALREELGKKCYVCLVCPGFCNTGIFREQKSRVSDKIVYVISTSAPKMAQKITRRLRARRKLVIAGYDAKFMDNLYRINRRASLAIFARFIRVSGLEMFKDVFEE